MRVPPVLLAFLTVSATIGLAHSVKAQTAVVASSPQWDALDHASQYSTASDVRMSSQEDIRATRPRPVSRRLPLEEATVQPGPAIAPHPLGQGAMSAPERMANEAIAQVDTAPDTPLTPTPPPGTQTPGLDEPNQVEFDITPGSPIQLEVEGEGAPTPTPDPDQPAVTPGIEPPPTGVEPPDTTEARVLVAEVAVSGVTGTLEDEVYNAIQTQPGRTTTRSQLQEDINAIFATGFFSNVTVAPEDTPLGVRVTYVVEANPVLQQVQLQDSAIETLQVDDPDIPGADTALTQPTQVVVDGIFADQYGETLNFRDLQAGIRQLNQIYQDNGYVLAQVIDTPQVSDNGVVTLVVAEGVIEDIQVVFLGEDGETVDEDGEPIEGKTREFIITREFQSEPGDVFNQQRIQADLQRVFGLGLFEDVRVSLSPGDDPRQVDVVVNVIERNTGSLGAGLGFSSASGLFGTVSFQENNLGGNNQRLGAELQVGERDLLFDVSFTDPWIATDPYRTSYTVNVFSRRTISLIFDGGEREVALPNGDRPRIQRLGGGVSFSRPLDEWLGLDNWRGSLGLQYQNVAIRDRDGELSPVDEFGNDLSFSGSGRDDLLLIQLSALRDLRNSILAPTSGSVLRVSTEQSVPIGSGSIFLNRLRASYSQYIPVRFTRFTEGCQADDASPADCPQTLAFNVQVGTVLGDLPPYEAFSLGGTDSVRGYDSGELGSGRSFLQATVEYRFPIISVIGGALFVDFGTDLGTADNVPGSPADLRRKPGNGFGYGLGLRVQSPVGQIRVDYGINDEGDGRLHFGIGERF